MTLELIAQVQARMKSTKGAARDRWPPYIGAPQVHACAHSCTLFGGKETTTGTRMLKAHHLRTYNNVLQYLPQLEALSWEPYVEPKTSGRVSLNGVIPSFVTLLPCYYLYELVAQSYKTASILGCPLTVISLEDVIPTRIYDQKTTPV